MRKSIQRAELTLFDFVYTPYPSYSFTICRYQTCYNKYTKSVENCGSMSIIVVKVSGLQNAFIRNQCIRKSHGPESNGAVRNPLFRGIVHWTKLKFTRLLSSFVKIYLAVAKRSEMFRLIRDQGSCKHLGFPIGPTNLNMVEEVEILLL